jgi:mono/diheme cytochrome c family protein
MGTRALQSLKVRKVLFALLLLAIVAAIVNSIQQNRPWIAPEEAKRRTNPMQNSAAILDSVRPLYRGKCAVCHGDAGKGDGHDAPLYDPAPTNFNDRKRMDSITDGELFYKLSEGRRPMPSFKKRLTEDQRWRLVLLIRSFGEPANAPASTDSQQR